MNNEHKTNLKFNLHIETEDVCKEEDVIVDFYVNIEELNELIKYIRESNINPHNVKFKDLETIVERPDIIVRLYDISYEIAFKRHLKDLMWTEKDFYDEAKFFMHTDDLDRAYSHYDMNTSYCDSDEEYYEKVRMNESIMRAYDNRYDQSVESLRNKILSKDIINSEVYYVNLFKLYQNELYKLLQYTPRRPK